MDNRLPNPHKLKIKSNKMLPVTQASNNRWTNGPLTDGQNKQIHRVQLKAVIHKINTMRLNMPETTV